jgi:hypothetical protein
MRADGPWSANTWWGKRTAAVNLAIVAALLAFLIWMAI